MATESAEPREARKRAAGLFDIRNIIGALLGIYGIVLLLVGLIGGSETAHTKVSGDTANIWVGIVLILAAAFFIVWARLRPIVVDEVEVERDKAKAEDEPGH